MGAAYKDNKKNDRVLVVIPAKNEEATVAGVVRDARKRIGARILVVDDGSSDQTAQVALAAGAEVLRLAFSLGAWGAIQTGMRFAMQRDIEIVVTMDADGQHHARSIPKLIEAVRETDCDVAVGACPRRLSRAKKVAWAYFRSMTRLTIHDFTSGLRAYNRDAVQVLATRFASLLDYQDIGVLMLLHKRGMRIQEVAVNMSPRAAGHSRVFSSWAVVFRYMLQTTVLCISKVGGVDRHPAELNRRMRTQGIL